MNKLSELVCALTSMAWDAICTLATIGAILVMAAALVALFVAGFVGVCRG